MAAKAASLRRTFGFRLIRLEAVLMKPGKGFQVVADRVDVRVPDSGPDSRPVDGAGQVLDDMATVAGDVAVEHVVADPGRGFGGEQVLAAAVFGMLDAVFARPDFAEDAMRDASRDVHDFACARR